MSGSAYAVYFGLIRWKFAIERHLLKNLAKKYTENLDRIMVFRTFASLLERTGA